MSLRITGGRHNGRPLKTPSGAGLTRPTSGKARQALFNMLAARLPESRFLDLFAGSGAVGLDALSRGAVEVVLVEKAPKAFACLQANCEALADAEGRAEPVHQAAEEFCEEAVALGKTWDLVFLDPPFDRDYAAWPERLRPLVAEGGLAVVQFPTRNPPPWLSEANRVRAYGESSFAFLEG